MSASHQVDRSRFGRGPWDNEPEDRVEWRGEHGRPCLMVRNSMGAWCGYVAVEPGHPWHGQSHMELGDVDAPGGLTYDGPCVEGGAVCHVPAEGETDDVWWVGFDCAHSWDVVPSMVGHIEGWGFSPWRAYRTSDEVRAEVGKLARQAHEAATAIVCGGCDGEGRVEHQSVGIASSGRLEERDCDRCGGTGRVPS